MTTYVNPEALLLARDARGCTQAEVADIAGVTQGLISKIEHGSGGRLDPPQIERIAKFLRYPPELFTDPEPRIREGASACLYHRKRKTVPIKLLKKLDAEMFLRTLNMQKLFNGLHVEGARIMHTMDTDDYEGLPENVARALRGAWRITPGPIKNMVTLLESAGAVVTFENFGTRKLFGMSCWSQRRQPLFYLNSDTPMEVLRWTLAHELGHLTMHASAPNGDPEDEADRFASEFLVPAVEVSPSLRNLDFERLPSLKTYWGISMKALITCAARLDAITPQRATRLYKQYSARRYNSGEPYTVPMEQPTLVRAAVRVHLDEHDYSIEELAKAVRLMPDEFRQKVLRDFEPRRDGNVVRLFTDN